MEGRVTLSLTRSSQLEPTFPAAINAVIKGARARTIAMEISEGSQDVAPKLVKEGRDCFVKMRPVIKPVIDIRGRDL